MKPCVALCVETPLLRAGGVTSIVTALARDLSSAYRVVLVSPDPPSSLPWPDSCEHRHFPACHNAKVPPSDLLAATAPLRIDLWHFHLGGLYGWSNHRWGRSPIVAMARQGFPVVTTIHSAASLLSGFTRPDRPWWYTWARLPLAWAAKQEQLSIVDREIVVSRDNLQKLRRWFSGFDDRWQLLYHSTLKSGAATSPPLPRQQCIVCLGELAPVKGQDLLVQAFVALADRYPDWSLHLYGPATDPEFLNHLQTLAGPNLRSGRIQIRPATREVASILQGCEVYVQPSRQEALGLALQEALAHGAACLAARTGGIPEMVDHRHNGLLFAPGDVPDLTAHLRELMDQPSLRHQLQDQGPRSIRMKDWSASNMAAQYASIYEKVLGRHASRRRS